MTKKSNSTEYVKNKWENEITLTFRRTNGTTIASFNGNAPTRKHGENLDGSV